MYPARRKRPQPLLILSLIVFFVNVLAKAFSVAQKADDYIFNRSFEAAD